MQEKAKIRVLIYKRTHTGDPNEDGVFGCRDCMGQIRNWKFDAVIGIGGKTAWKGQEDICCKINWIGIEPKEIYPPTMRGRRLVFAHFVLKDRDGEKIEDYYPHLHKHMYRKNSKRFALISADSSETKDVFSDVKKILDSIKDSPASKVYFNNNNLLPPKGCSNLPDCNTDCG
jgi:hypothetical protein